MKGIVLAGGSGSRLGPLTKTTSKQLLPIYDKPMIFYPLQTLYDAGIREILLISTPEHIHLYRRLLEIHNWSGMNLHYLVQERPEGLPQAFIIGENFIGTDDVTLILGDNIFIGDQVSEEISLMKSVKGAKIFGKRVLDPERFGVAEINNDHNVISLEEKPKEPKSDIAVVGLYVYDNTVVNKAKSLLPSERGELEITDLNLSYLKEGNLDLVLIGNNCDWLDTGTFDSLLDASNLVRSRKRQ